jgi:hypothetical protein
VKKRLVYKLLTKILLREKGILRVIPVRWSAMRASIEQMGSLQRNSGGSTASTLMTGTRKKWGRDFKVCIVRVDYPHFFVSQK